MAGIIRTPEDELKSSMLKQARAKLGITQLQFAEILGCPNSTLCEWETGRRIPRGLTWKFLSDAMTGQGITFGKDGVLIEKRKKRVA